MTLNVWKPSPIEETLRRMHRSWWATSSRLSSKVPSAPGPRRSARGRWPVDRDAMCGVVTPRYVCGRLTGDHPGSESSRRVSNKVLACFPTPCQCPASSWPASIGPASIWAALSGQPRSGRLSLAGSFPTAAVRAADRGSHPARGAQDRLKTSGDADDGPDGMRPVDDIASSGWPRTSPGGGLRVPLRSRRGSSSQTRSSSSRRPPC